MYLICDEYGIIKKTSDELLSVVEYKSFELDGHFIGVLMSPFMSFLHSSYLLPMYRSMTPEQSERSHQLLSNKTIPNRPLIIYTKSGIPLSVSLQVDHYINESQQVFRLTVHHFTKMDASMIYTSEIDPPEISEFNQSQQDMMVICWI